MSTSNKGYCFVLRTNDKENKGYGGFLWPRKGKVECPDWNPEPVCGGGLHGLLNGQGAPGLLSWSADAIWQVVKVLESDIVRIGDDKVKFPRGVVVHTGDRKSATDYLRAKIGPGLLIPGEFVTVGDKGQATAGYKGQATAGDYGHATAGNRGTATAGDYGHATAGDYGQATAGKDGILECRWWFDDNGTYKPRIAVFYEGEDFKAGVKYRFECEGKVCKLVEVNHE